MESLRGELLNLLPQGMVWMFIFYLVCKVADFALGILKSWKNKNYKSRIMREGVIRFIAEIIGVIFVIGADLLLGTKFMLTLMTLGLFIYKEAGSIAENLAECGVTLPGVIAERLEVLNPDNKKENIELED